MAKHPPPQAPLTHGDAVTHRTLLAQRSNATLPKNGGEPMTGPLPLLSVTVAGLADYPAADWAGSAVYVSDGAANEKIRYSDGSAWVILG